MRYCEIISEGVDEDAERQKVASKVFHAFARYAYAHKVADFEVEFDNGETLWGFDPQNFGVAGLLGSPDCMIMVGKRHAHRGEAAYKVFGQTIAGRFKRAIVLYCAKNDTQEAAIVAANSTEAMSLFKHEMIHVLDDIAHGKMFSVHKIDPEDRSENGFKNYYNQPWEFNARYHQIVDSLLNILNAYKQDGLQAAQDEAMLVDFTGNFADDMARALGTHPDGKKFLATLSEPRRRSFLRRLYQLHARIVAIVNATEDPRATAA